MEDQSRLPACQTAFGWYKFRPKCLQFFCKPAWALFFICCGVFFQGFLINGLIHFDIGLLEKKFNLKSRETGLICSSYDISSVAVLIPITYFGGQENASKPFWFGFGLLLLSFGCFVFVVPEFLIESTGYTNKMETEIPLCNVGYGGKKEICKSESKTSPAFWIFFISNLFSGVGGCTLYTVAVAYIDESVPKATSAIYIAIFYLMAIVGTGAGFLCGGLTMRIDNRLFFLQSYRSSAEIINPDDASFSPAWWLGFVFCGFMFFIIAIPNLGFPPKLPGTESVKVAKAAEMHEIVSGPIEHGGLLTGIPRAVFNVIKNPTFLFLSIAGCTDALIVNGTSLFLPKILEHQFYIRSTPSSIIISIVAGGGGLLGVVFGGLAIKIWDFNMYKTLKFCIYLAVIVYVCLPITILHCPQKKVAGLTADYHNSTEKKLTSSCNRNCSCVQEKLLPVCGADGTEYYSPCYAGCAAHSKSSKGIYKFYNCTCINNKFPGDKAEASGDSCSSVCLPSYIFVGCASVAVFFIFAALVPGITATLRCVRISQRSLALGIQWLMVRACGIFGLGIIGHNIDMACFHWVKKCGRNTSCYIYDNINLSWRLFTMAIGSKTVGFICLTLALLFYRPARVNLPRSD